jgi:hypothetical protein
MRNCLIKFLLIRKSQNDALKILEGGVLKEVNKSKEVTFMHQHTVASEFKSPYKDPQKKVHHLHEYIKRCDKQFDEGSQDKWYSPNISIVRALDEESLGSCVNYRNLFVYCICPIKEKKPLDFLKEPLKPLSS